MARRIKIYGQRNSGTNYLEKLIRKNLKVEIIPGSSPDWTSIIANYFVHASRFLGRERAWHVDLDIVWFWVTERENMGWKHRIVEPNKINDKNAGNILFLTITKNPYAWLISAFRRPYGIVNPKKVRSIKEFVDHEVENIRHHEAGWGISSLRSPVDLWNIKQKKYLGLGHNFECVNLRYEDLLQKTKNEINNIGIKLDNKIKNDEFRNVRNSTKGDDKDINFYKNYYLGDGWMRDISPEAVKLINERLDKDVAGQFAYEIIDPSDVAGK
jgi:hypothetical protein